MKNNPVEMIPIDRIKIINPRFRDRKKFDTIIQSVRNQGMKKPIKVAVRGTNGEDMRVASKMG